MSKGFAKVEATRIGKRSLEEGLKAHPDLKARLEKMLDIVENAPGDIEKATACRTSPPMGSPAPPSPSARRTPTARTTRRNTGKWLGPKEEIGNKGGSLSNRLRAALKG